ncbi:type II toxin-antitoxin system Phd/YefM family antitoxin [Prosthecomicrobium hirschii]|uniref:type II toxin-antitoxin system Phd/YefM family antitoxin n=1 Tax=Prosthecodimorpha hirschii TaxID=665126 RepID=UPI001127C9FB|nr:type II toxin-antitoxin system prevent-host-death family antitoxin [Prosthecomicrobium hirschii]MCW1844027.1 type II toxin-antitoxin system prevent-host-death family antitoxin [Prosthecomicrobium hirschii]TPQ46196.1 type II toxin-antitoxin system prevent-host-death family antitoxin [Prosthecomicrobium hirschii]
MNIPLKDAEGHLAELVRRAEAGEEIVLTREGAPAAKLVALAPATERCVSANGDDIYAAIDRISRSASAKATPGPDAARSQDFLYGHDGLPL